MITIVDFSVTVASLLLVFYGFRKRRAFPLPPGPRGLPLVGNMFDLPKSYEWETYAKWSKELGSDVIHLSVAGDHIIVVNSFDASYELFEKKSSIYSDRPPMPMVKDLIGWNWNVGFMAYNSDWKDAHRLLHENLNARDTHIYHAEILGGAREVCRRLIDHPDNFLDHLRHMAGALIMRISYGIEVEPHDDPYIDIAEKALFGLSEAGNPGSYLVDALPFLKYVPDWFPGAKFKRQAKEWSIPTAAMADRPLQYVKDNLAKGTANPCFSAKCLQDMEDDPNSDRVRWNRVIRSISGTLYAAASETTVSALGAFFVAMTLYPEVQKKAQRELDNLFNGRLPEFIDGNAAEALPYIDALIKEMLRWKSVTPLAIPHRLMEDDIYKGYFIPKGSIVAGNAWAMLHDENIYTDPESFIPERFLTEDGKANPSVRSPMDAAFGFGRRLCAGKHIALASIWATIVSILTTFDISMAKNDEGRFIVPSGEFTSGLVSNPVPFPCVIKPRSKYHEHLITDLCRK